ncbi:MAG: hypothetical protein PHY13_04905 [Clostridia bacterium]|jgi:hypothetical protein|nr:hypothetical protein [Clostridia bacterium]NLF37240.1 hypothetical protein [Clostridiaceae bacterium]MDD3094529.1 hypothetical protein [Clostridia bacterium]MDD3970364.1 hypothetical protein [Clostridia bacterium]MDD4543093.1 hypothetical protein [Clostridia bacterium]
MSQILEACMVICFGISWPMNIIKSLRSRTAKGKSLLFLILVLLGYCCAITGKIISDSVNWVFWFYVVNLVMVITDIVLYYINRKADIEADGYTHNRK